MRQSPHSSQKGASLVTVLIGLTLISTVASAVAAVGLIEYKASRDYLGVTGASFVATAGANHALALKLGPLFHSSFNELLLGADGSPGPPGQVCRDNYEWSCVGADASDDGVLAGHFGLAASDEIPAAGLPYAEGTYSVRLVNDLEDPSGDPYNDTNDRVVAVCRGDTPRGGVAEIKVMMESLHYPAFTVNGNLSVANNVRVEGPCAGVHSNGTAQLEAGAVVQGPITASDSVIEPWSPAEEPDHATEITWGARPLEVPKLDPLDYCDDADYILRNGWQINMTATPDSFQLDSNTDWTYKQPWNEYKLSGPTSQLGVFCIDGNVLYTASMGSDSVPSPISLIATGSVTVAGQSRLSPAHADGVLILSGADVQIGGQAGARYSGLIYTENQCNITGQASVEALVLCYNAPDTDSYEANDLFDTNELLGATVVSYDCSSWRQPARAAAWWE